MGKPRGLYIEDLILRRMRALRWGYSRDRFDDESRGIDAVQRSMGGRTFEFWLNMQFSLHIHDDRKLESFIRDRESSRGPSAWLFAAFADNGDNSRRLVDGLIGALEERFGRMGPKRRWVYRLLVNEDGSWVWDDPRLTLRALRRRREMGLYSDKRRRGRVIKINGSAFILQEEDSIGNGGRRLAYFSSLESSSPEDISVGDWLWYYPEDRQISGLPLVEYVVAEKNAPARFRAGMAVTA